MAVDNREDCYFFLNGGCSKANMCQFRHSEEAIKTINVCTEWMESKMCKTEGCTLRHSTYHIATPLPVQKDTRSEVLCYWEQNGGCKKYHCPYKHNTPNKTPGFTSFRPTPAANPGPIHYNTGANTFTPRPQTFPSHHKTLILNNGAPTQASGSIVPQVPAVAPVQQAQPAITFTAPVRPVQSDALGGVQIKNISTNGNGRSSTIGGDSSKTQISFKSSRPVPEARPQQKSVFDRLSNLKTSPDTLKPKDLPSRKISKSASPRSLNDSSDSFSGIKVKTLDEILKEKRRRQGQDSNNTPVPDPTSTPVSNQTSTPVSKPITENVLPTTIATHNQFPTAPRASGACLTDALLPKASNGAEKRKNDFEKPEAKKLKETETLDLLDDDEFDLDFDDMEFSEADSNLLELELDADFL